MNKEITIKTILEDVKRGSLSKGEASEIFISLIDGSDNAHIRSSCINALDEISYKSTNIFSILENLLISDNNSSVRNAAARAITHNYLKEGIKSLNWAITHDNSPLVLKTIFDFFENFNEKPIQILYRDIQSWIENFAKNLGVVPQEAKFFLDLEALFALDNDDYEIETETYKYLENLNDFVYKIPWLKITNKHVEILNFNYFNWKYLKENKNSIESFFKLSYPDLFLNSIQNLYINYTNSFQLPESISLLKYLKILNLSGNHLKLIPESIGKLTKLERLDLSNNDIKELPECIIRLKNLRFLKLKDNKISTIPENLMDFLSSLERFKI
jgi:Leucine-rich repeat (LRR) protein